MGLLERVFGRKTKADDQLQRSEIFRLLDGYRPIYTSWCGELYESELVRAAIDAKARQASKLEMVMAGE
ncbi:MAG: phage portal protein, partial [Clostridia bacterium]|nr:phage portal protein [Clostridia bacterium]